MNVDTGAGFFVPLAVALAPDEMLDLGRFHKLKGSNTLLYRFAIHVDLPKTQKERTTGV